MRQNYTIFQSADLGAGFFSVLESRMAVVDFSDFLGLESHTIIMKNVEHDSKVEVILSPFHPQVKISLKKSFIFCLGKS